MTGQDHISEASSAAAGGPRRRRWRWILLGVVGVLAVLVLVGPYIASMGPARGIVVSTLNETFKGTFRLEGLSLSWFGPCEVRGFVVTDTLTGLVWNFSPEETVRRRAEYQLWIEAGARLISTQVTRCG